MEDASGNGRVFYFPQVVGAAPIDAVNAFADPPAHVVVTGDLVDRGKRAEYEHFAEIMATLRVPYYVIPGNHDDREKLRAVLDPATYGASTDSQTRFDVEDREIRFIGLDANRPPSPGGSLDWTMGAGFTTLLYRRDASGTFEPNSRIEGR